MLSLAQWIHPQHGDFNSRPPLFAMLASLFLLLGCDTSGSHNKQAPGIEGEPLEGALLKATPGDWERRSEAELKTQWQRCTLQPPWMSSQSAPREECVDIEDATAAEYRLREADLGTLVRVRETFSLEGRSETATSSPLGPIEHGTPFCLVEPQWQGTAALWQTLGLTTGVWTNGQHGDLTCRFSRCNASGDNCVQFDSTLHSDRDVCRVLVLPEDVGARIKAVVTARDGEREGSSEALTPPVAAAAPLNFQQPLIGFVSPLWTPQENNWREGEIATSEPGVWGFAPGAFHAFQWLRCDDAGDNCSDITGAIGTTYSLSAEDVGRKLRVRVTTTDKFGSTSAVSFPSQSAVRAAAPVNITPPSVSGVAEVGEVLTVTPGVWTGTGTIEYFNHWERCTAGCAQCSALIGQIDSTYRVQDADRGSILRAVVTASIGLEAQTVRSACSGTIP